MTYNKCCRGSSLRPVYMGGGRRGRCGKQEVFADSTGKKLLLSDLTKIELPGDQTREIWLAKTTTNTQHLHCEARWFGHQDLGRPLSSRPQKVRRRFISTNPGGSSGSVCKRRISTVIQQKLHKNGSETTRSVFWSGQVRAQI